jgi:hypothetical protein
MIGFLFWKRDQERCNCMGSMFDSKPHFLINEVRRRNRQGSLLNGLIIQMRWIRTRKKVNGKQMHVLMMESKGLRIG